MVWNMDLITVLKMFLNLVSNLVLNTVLNMDLRMVLNMYLNMVSNTVLNMNSSRNTNLFSSKQFISFSFYIIRLILDFSLRSSFIRVNISNSNKINEDSSYEMEPSDNAFEMRLLIVLSYESANIAMISWYSIFKDSFVIA